ncbi:hypothetical protein [Pontibacter litorisediminis]|uniref:hypothetical protein n=1 Tax=Pontibacter litorisediminis TaxID=1846260 RepID=UPI0023ECA4FF|nr:hypothetical protein [Pontibacter litorisediminis]
MKRFFIIPLLGLALLSCNKTEAPVLAQKDESQHILKDMTESQKWQLVRMTGQIPNAELTGDKMAWQEYYLLNPDGSFTKVRQQGGVSTSASGTYTYHSSSDEKYLELSYAAPSAIIGTCTSDSKERLTLIKDRLQSSWQACDGPGLEYKKVD